MGGISSKNFQDLLDEDGNELQQQEGGRTLPPNLDPRSPSSDICRTPIHVSQCLISVMTTFLLIRLVGFTE